MGCIEKVYILGVFFVVTQIFCPLSWILASKIYGENISQFRGCLSLSDIMRQLYGSVGRHIANITSILISTVVLAMQAIAMGNIIDYFFHTHIV